MFLWHKPEEGSIFTDNLETAALRKQSCCISLPAFEMSPRMNTSVSSSIESSLKLQHLYRDILKLRPYRKTLIRNDKRGLYKMHQEVIVVNNSLLSHIQRWAHHRFPKYCAGWPRAPASRRICSARLPKQIFQQMQSK